MSSYMIVDQFVDQFVHEKTKMENFNKMGKKFNKTKKTSIKLKFSKLLGVSNSQRKISCDACSFYGKIVLKQTHNVDQI